MVETRLCDEMKQSLPGHRHGCGADSNSSIIWRLRNLSFDCFICCFEEESRKHWEDNFAPLTVKKRRRKRLPIVPSEDPDQRLAQIGTHASSLIALGIKYSDDLT
ncbi:hypothetical protein Bca4012_089590 [Brassica carinata]